MVIHKLLQTYRLCARKILFCTPIFFFILFFLETKYKDLFLHRKYLIIEYSIEFIDLAREANANCKQRCVSFGKKIFRVVHVRGNLSS